MELNENVAELIGAIIGDGNIYRKDNHYRICFTGDINNDKLYFEYLKILIEKEWNKQVRIFIGGRGLRIVINSKEVCNALINEIGLPYGKGKGEIVTIPKKIASDWNYSKFAIRGIVDTDGTIFVSKKPEIEKYLSIEIATCSEYLAVQLKGILESRGFRVNKIRKTPARYNSALINRIALNGKGQVKKCLDEIGFLNPYKLERAIAYIE